MGKIWIARNRICLSIFLCMCHLRLLGFLENLQVRDGTSEQQDAEGRAGGLELLGVTSRQLRRHSDLF